MLNDKKSNSKKLIDKDGMIYMFSLDETLRSIAVGASLDIPRQVVVPRYVSARASQLRKYGYKFSISYYELDEGCVVSRIK